MNPGKAHLDQDVTISLAQLDRLPQAEFLLALEGVVENSPWVVQRAFAKRPFGSLPELQRALVGCIRDATPQEQIRLFSVHPELSGSEAMAGTMTAASSGEQDRLGLTRLDAADFGRLGRLNRAYAARFGFPFITALRLHDDLASVFASCETRMGNDVEGETLVAIEQISAIIEGRLAHRFPDGPDS